MEADRLKTEGDLKRLLRAGSSRDYVKYENKCYVVIA